MYWIGILGVKYVGGQRELIGQIESKKMVIDSKLHVLE